MNLHNLTDKLNANIYLSSAAELGLGFKIIEKQIGYVKIFNPSKELHVINATLDINNVVSRVISIDKALTYSILKENEIPVAEQLLIKIDPSKSQEEIIQEIKSQIETRFSFPFVLKPNDMGNGEGVYPNILSWEEFEFAVRDILSLKTENLLVEDHILGKDYRILALDGNVLDVIERIPAYITGDGESTIKELIQKKNKLRESQEMPPIKVDEKSLNLIKKSGFELTSIPLKEQFILLRNNCNLSEGGEVKKIELSTLDAENISLFEKVAKISRLSLCGIDFISPDITQNYKSQKCTLNEVNSSPGIMLHYFAWGNLEVSKQIISKIFGL